MLHCKYKLSSIFISHIVLLRSRQKHVLASHYDQCVHHNRRASGSLSAVGKTHVKASPSTFNIITSIENVWTFVVIFLGNQL